MQIKINETKPEIKDENLKNLNCSKQDLKKLKNTLLWRYMSFPKFLDLILNGRLYFSDITTLMKEDPFESMLPLYGDYPVYIQKVVNEIKKVNQKDMDIDTTLRQNIPNYDELERVAEYFNDIRKTTYVNCWHTNNSENYAMWKIYACSDASVAVVTNYEMLNNAIRTDKNVTAGLVKYNNKEILTKKFYEINFDNQKKIKSIIKKASFYKRKCFEYEQEFRMLYQDNNILNPDKNYISVDINKLIKCIYISPTTENFIRNSIVSILKELKKNNKLTLDIDKIIINSSINGNEFNNIIGAISRLCLENYKNNKHKKMNKNEQGIAALLLLLCANNDLPYLLSSSLKDNS